MARPPEKKTAAHRTGQAASPPETVDPRWLLRALALSLCAAVVCAYLTGCLLFYQGIWQLVLHPSHQVDRTPANIGIDFTSVRFGEYDTGQPHLTGWWIAADPSAKYSRLTVLYLHDGSGSLAQTLNTLAWLHGSGVNVFAIDYRGFGASDRSQHPDADRMQQDGFAALDYLVSTRHIPPGSILPMGSGLGGSLAVRLAADQSAIPAVIVDNPEPDPASVAASLGPKLMPVRWLFGDRFSIARPLASLARPKLLIAGGDGLSSAQTARIASLYQRAASPKYTVILPADSDRARVEALRRFLDDSVQGR